jgi:hypothetical protein
MTLPSPIQGFLDEFEHALKLSGRRRRRVLDEVRDHLIDATERGIGAGMDPAVAEVAAVDASALPRACWTPDFGRVG